MVRNNTLRLILTRALLIAALSAVTSGVALAATREPVTEHTYQRLRHEASKTLGANAFACVTAFKREREGEYVGFRLKVTTQAARRRAAGLQRSNDVIKGIEVVPSRYSLAESESIMRTVRRVMSSYDEVAIRSRERIGRSESLAGQCPPSVEVRVPSETAAEKQGQELERQYGKDRIRVVVEVLGRIHRPA